MNLDKESEFWELESFTKYFPKYHDSWTDFQIGSTGESSGNGTLVLDHYRDAKTGKSDFSNKILDKLYGFHDFSTDSIKYPETQFWDDEEFGDALMETFDFGAMKRGDMIEKGNDVHCSCIHEIEQAIFDDTDNSYSYDQIKFFVVVFQCDVVLVAVRGFCFEKEFQEELFVYWTFDGNWVVNKVVNGYLGEMRGDLNSEDDDDFFDDSDEDNDG